MPELATPEEIIAICLDNSWDRDGGYWYGFGKTVTPRQLRDAFEQVHAALAASQERVRELEAENVALRANTSASVVRRLVEQGAIRGPELPAVWKAATLREIARKISEVTFSEKWEKHAAFLVQLADDFDAESPA